MQVPKCHAGHCNYPMIQYDMSISLNLVVLRSADIDHAADFYTRMGLQFEKHRHGNGPEHYAAELSGGVFEIYPLSDSEPTTAGTRIGFKVPSIDATIEALVDEDAIVSPAKNSQWGRRAIVRDPDGHRVELVES